MTPQIFLPEYPRPELERLVLEDYLMPGDYVFASGLETNNHLDMAYDEVLTDLRFEVFATLGDLVVKAGIEPTFIASVPEGANGWGEELAHYLSWGTNIPHLQFEKVDRRVFKNLPHITKRIARLKAEYGTPNGVVVDDVSNDGGTGEAMADFLTDQGLEIQLIESVFYRGKLEELDSKYPRAFWMAKHIPLMLDWDKFRATGEIVSL